MNWDEYRTKLPPRVVLLIETDFPRLRETGVINLSRTEKRDGPSVVRSMNPEVKAQWKMGTTRTTDVTIQAPIGEPGFVGTAKYRQVSGTGDLVAEAYQVYRVEGVDVEYNSRYDTFPKDYAFPPARVQPVEELNVEESVDSYREGTVEARFAGILFEEDE